MKKNQLLSDVIKKIEDLIKKDDNIKSTPLWGTFCGIEMIPLDGLKDKLLMFTDREMMNKFLEQVDKEKALMFVSQECAVENTIKFYEFLGKVKSGEMIEKDVSNEQEICESEGKLPFKRLGGQRLQSDR